MVQIYVGRDHLDALRFKNFLEREGIDAEIRETAAQTRESVDGMTKSTVWIADERAIAAGALLEEFLAISSQSSEEGSPLDEAGSESVDDAAPEAVAHPQPAVKVRIPWLTVLYCSACVVASVGGWRESRQAGPSEQVLWGWRDGLDVIEGSYWAILTSTLPHRTVSHLVMNLLGVLPLGMAIERGCGRACWLGLLLSSMLVNASVWLAMTGQLGYGASGILYAFFGFLLAASIRKRLMPIWLLLPLSIWFGFFAIGDISHVLECLRAERRVDFEGAYVHIGGLVWGFLFAPAFVFTWKPIVMRTAAVGILLVALIPLRGSPWLHEWLLSRADRAYRRENVWSAVDWYSRAIAGDSESASAYVGRGTAYLDDSRFEEAIADFEEAVLKDPKAPYARGLRAQAFVFRSDFASALEAANQEFQDGPASTLAFSFATRAYVRLITNDFDKAVADQTNAIEHEPRAAQHFAARGSTRLELGQYEKAMADANQAVFLAPKDGDSHLLRGCILADLVQEERARIEFELAYNKLESDLPRQPRNVRLLCPLAAIQLKLFELDRKPERLRTAFEYAERAVAAAPEYSYAWQVRGDVEFNRQEFVAAERDLSRSIELDPHDYSAACARGLARLELGRLDEALRDLDHSLAVNPRSTHGYRSRALVQNARGQFHEAVIDATRAIELNGRSAEAYHVRGKARLASGDEREGRADLDRAIEIDPKIASRMLKTSSAKEPIE